MKIPKQFKTTFYIIIVIACITDVIFVVWGTLMGNISRGGGSGDPKHIEANLEAHHITPEQRAITKQRHEGIVVCKDNIHNSILKQGCLAREAQKDIIRNLLQ